MKRAERILEILYDREGGYVAMEELSRAVGLDRQGLDRRLGALERLGHRMEYSPAGGVRLLRPARPAPVLIERDLPTRRIGRSVVCFDEVSSTNDVALAAARQADADGLVVLAERQRAGRGRHGRQWVSPAGSGILMSVLLMDSPGRSGASDAVTIAAGLATAEAIERATGLSCGLKWPNDVLLEDGKVAGVLVETRTGPGARVTVIGIGVNVNAAPPAEAVDRPGGAPGRAPCRAGRARGGGPQPADTPGRLAGAGRSGPVGRAAPGVRFPLPDDQRACDDPQRRQGLHGPGAGRGPAGGAGSPGRRRGDVPPAGRGIERCLSFSCNILGAMGVIPVTRAGKLLGPAR